MKAIVKYAAGKGNVEVREVPEPMPGPQQVKVEVKAAGVCGSDLHIYHDEIAIPVLPPVIMGHEFAGLVAAVGEGVEGVRPGDRVTCETTAWFCGRCLPCRAGHYNMCAQRKVIGYSVDGCFAPYCIVHERQVHLLPEGVDLIAGALSEPLACCVHAVLELTSVTAGDLAVVAGPGPIGLICMQLARAAGATVVVAGTATDSERLTLARRLGAGLAVDITSQDLTELVADMTAGQGADVYFECSGAPAAARQGLAITRRGGQYTQVGLFPRPFELAFDTIAYRELRVTGSLGQRSSSWRRGLALLGQGLVDTRSLVSHILPLDGWQEAFHLVESRRGLKVVLQP
jgi:L-iditol 2-dehydrogenase